MPERRDPDPTRPRVTLTVGATDWAGWTDIEITRSLKAGAGAFNLELTERWGAGDEPRPLSPGLVCTVAIDGETVVSGYIDDVRPSYDAEQHSVRVSGRDRSGDLADCSAPGGEWHNLALPQIVGALAAPFGIRVGVEAEVGPAFPRFRVTEGETVWSAIVRACRARGVMAVADGAGNLVLTRARGAGTASVAVVRGGAEGTILAADATYSWRDRFSQYIVKAQQGGLAGTPDGRASVIAEIRDPGVNRYRPRIIVASDPHHEASARLHAQWECNTAAGSSRLVNVRVAGWRDQAGKLWEPNRTVRVRCPWLALDHDLLLSGVHLSLSEQGGTTADLELTDPAAFEVEPLPEEDTLGW